MRGARWTRRPEKRLDRRLSCELQRTAAEYASRLLTDTGQLRTRSGDWHDGSLRKTTLYIGLLITLDVVLLVWKVVPSAEVPSTSGGPTLFDLLVEIIREHGVGGEEAEDGVGLVVR